ncbi:MAG: helix-turn-helix transcriptional regulator [Oscillospiraceae bacterium]|nr:helix-turn-helix transcriptional regulator [Oscillospiraceae bacterium]
MGETFPAILCRLRKERRLNQRTAAADLHISQALLSHYENGLREPGLAFVTEACSYYGVSADYLLGRTRIRTAMPDMEKWDPALLSMGESGTRALAELIRALGETGSRESCRLAEEWLAVSLYMLLRNRDRDGCCKLPQELSQSLWEAYSGLAKARMTPGQPGAPELSLPPELAERAESVLRGFWDEWREQV